MEHAFSPYFKKLAQFTKLATSYIEGIHNAKEVSR
jgi:hypothetical protein